MCDLSKLKPTGYCRSKNKLRTVSTTKWELPLPGSKPYWDKICDALEKRKEHVSDLSYPSSPSPDSLITPNVMLSRRDLTLNKSNHVVEPIVKISPPTPMRMMSKNRGITITGNPMISENARENLGVNNLIGSGDDRLYEVSVRMTDFLKSNKPRTKNSCQIHKNAPLLKIFDDNLKTLLPKKKVKPKSASHTTPMLSYGNLDFSKLHRNKSCPLRVRSNPKERKEFSISSVENKRQDVRSLRKTKTVESDTKNAISKFEQSLKIPESDYVSIRSISKYKKVSSIQKSKSQIIRSNLNYMLSIPKLDDNSPNQNLFTSSVDAIDDSSSNSQRRRQTPRIEYNGQSNMINMLEPDQGKSDERGKESDRTASSNLTSEMKADCKDVPTQGTSLPKVSLDDTMCIGNVKRVDKHRPMTAKARDEQAKNLLNVPKLGMLSSYPSFSKLTVGGSVDVEECQEAEAQASVEARDSKVLEVESSKRDLLKVPKLSMMSSYPSFNSLIPDSFDSDDNAAGVPESIGKRGGQEVGSDVSISSNLRATQYTAISAEKPTPASMSTEKTDNTNENSDLATTLTKQGSSNLVSANDEPRRRQSLKNSVRYAYRALKFLTPNKTLDFQPQRYEPMEKSDSSSSASSINSRASKYSKFEPSIKLLTYEDIRRDMPLVRSDSSISYGSVRSRLRRSASEHLGFNYARSKSMVRPETASTTIPSLTRTTSGPTESFQEPVLNRPSEEVLNKLPKMSVFPRRKFDKCFACLHKPFEEPVEPRRELPLATWNAVVRQPSLILSESESSSISLPDAKDFPESQSDYEDNWKEVLKDTNGLDKTESSRGSMKNTETLRLRQSVARTSEEIQSTKTDIKFENVMKNMSSKGSIASSTQVKALSVSSEHSKPSSISGHSSESEEPQVQVKPVVPASGCLESPYAPLYWAPSFDPLKSLKLRKPVSMYGRAVSVAKTEDESTSDDDENEYRSARKETKLKSKDDAVRGSKSMLNFGDKPELAKQPSVAAKMISTQLSTVATLTKKQSRVDLLSGGMQSENDSKSKESDDDKQKAPKQFIKDLPDQKLSSEKLLELVENSVFNERDVEREDVGRSSTKSPLPLIDEQLIENENAIAGGDQENLETDQSTVEHSLSRKRQKIGREFYSNENVIRILEKCVQESCTPLEMLEHLSAEANRNYPLTCENSKTNREIARSAKVARNLMKLLVTSKKYLNPDTFSHNLEFSSSQPPLCNPRQLRRVLPARTYNLVARILGMPEHPAEKSLKRKSDFKALQQSGELFRVGESRNRGTSVDSCDMIVHPPSDRGHEKLTIDEDEFECPQLSPYALFMRKPRRKAIKWRPLTERDMLGYDPEATLKMRATRVTNKICEDFCEWLRSIGGGHGDDIDEEVLKDMFQIEFTAEACRTMQVLVKEIPMVPAAVALARNTPGAEELALTRRHLVRDAKAEGMPKRILGFGSMLPRSQRFIPPKNRVNERWLQCENVPQDLETMDAVWKGITHLDSVKGFLTWAKEHPEIKPPKLLMEAYSRKETLVRQASMEETGNHFEMEMNRSHSLKVGDVE